MLHPHARGSHAPAGLRPLTGLLLGGTAFVALPLTAAAQQADSEEVFVLPTIVVENAGPATPTTPSSSRAGSRAAARSHRTS